MYKHTHTTVLLQNTELMPPLSPAEFSWVYSWLTWQGVICFHSLVEHFQVTMYPFVLRTTAWHTWEGGMFSLSVLNRSWIFNKGKMESRAPLKYGIPFLIGFWCFLALPWALSFAKEKIFGFSWRKLGNPQNCKNQVHLCFYCSTKKQSGTFYPL